VTSAETTVTPRAQRRPSFFWQGLLILLPVALMAGIGLTAILRDRAAVEHEAQQRAGEILRQLAPDLARRVAGQLAEFNLAADDWSQYHRTWLPNQRTSLFDPYAEGQSMRRLPAKGAPREKDLGDFSELPEERLGPWQAAYPGLDPAQLFPNRLSFAANEALPESPDDHQPPVPPAWFVGLSSEQRDAWNALRQLRLAHSTTNEVDAAIQRFLDLHPPEEGTANAEFVRFQHGSGTATRTAFGFLWFARAHRGVATESGLPLSNLAISEALWSAGSNTYWGSVLDGLLDEGTKAPSFLMPCLLDKARSLIANAGGSADVRSNFETLWSAQQRLARIAWAVQQTGSLHATTDLWVTADNARWFCSLTTTNGIATELSKAGNVPTHRESLTNTITELRVYPQAFLERAFAQVLRETKPSIPGYLGLSAELEGERLNPALGPELQRGTPKIFAEIQERLMLPIISAGDDLERPRLLHVQLDGVPTVNSLPTANIDVRTDVPNTRPGPQLTLRLSLVDPAQLFAQQQQRTLLFGGLILASALTAFVGLLTARQAFYRQLRLSELKSDFVSSVSHELRSPIASVRLMAESLERGKIAGVPKQLEYFRFIGQECRRLSSLIENVLDFSRIEQGRKQYEFEPTDLAALAQQTVKLMETYASERQVKLALSIPEAQISLLATQPRVDGKAIQQALVNLIDNAMKHSPKGGAVSVGVGVQSPKSKVQSPKSTVQSPGSRVHGAKSEVQDAKCEVESQESRQAGRASRHARDGGTVLIWVEDQGEGIPEEEQERIFERFYRRGSELRRETQGVGIGLSIVKHITEAHSGRVCVRSAPGKGSRFTIELPLWNES
jgi:signal transduction histidine kinase